MDAKDAQGDVITITEEDITPSHLSKFQETSEKLDVLVDVDKGIWVTEGVPVENPNIPTSQIVFPDDKPHVFMAHDLLVNDKGHKNVALKDVVVIMAHGYRDGDTWKFQNGQEVEATIKAFNSYAEEKGIPKIEFVLSCNKDNAPDPLGIKVKDISERHIAQAVGEEVHMWRRDFINGRVAMSVSVEDEFWGLDDLITYRSISILPDVDQTSAK